MSIEAMLEEIRVLPVRERKRLISLIVETFPEESENSRRKQQRMKFVGTANDYLPDDFFARLDTIPSDNAFERPPQGEYEIREPIE